MTSPERLRVVQLIPTLDRSGAEKQLTLLATHLPRDRFDVRVVALTRGGPYEKRLRDEGIPVEVVGKRFKLDPATVWRLLATIRRHAPHIVQTWLFAANAYGRPIARWAGVPIVIASERCVDRWKGQHQFAIDRLLARRTDVVVCNANAVAAFYESVGIPRHKLRVIGNAVEPLGDTPNPASVARDLRLQLGLPADASIVGFIGRLWPQKRVQDLIWALDVLRIGGWNTHLLVIGEGPRRDALRRFTHNLELDDRVHFLGHRPDIDRLMELIDVVAIPSKFEGMPNVALEAMQRGKPVVATRIPGMDEVVVDGETGLLVEPKTPFALAQAIHQLLSDADLRRTMGEAGRRRVASVFAVERMVAAYASLYEALAEAKGLRPVPV